MTTVTTEGAHPVPADRPDVPRLNVEDLLDSPDRAGAAISPDGSKFTYLAPWRDRLNVWIQDLDGEGEAGNCAASWCDEVPPVNCARRPRSSSSETRVSTVAISFSVKAISRRCDVQYLPQAEYADVRSDEECGFPDAPRRSSAGQAGPGRLFEE
ncbi:hypothetical protein ACH4Y0_30050 [Streptomyces sp. NPDC020707]|uniref:hypothetical protein n=1 Tax=Streptomyces sp. NPDC020707 TaxID=3365084 RepID=UPI0037B8A9D2